MRNIVVVEHASDWPEKFAVEARRLSDTLMSALIAIHHIGSTSVPGLAAKPIIDILAVVRRVNELDACNDAMIDLGYEPKGEFGIIGRRFFAKGSDACRTHHVHAYEPGHLEIGAHLAAAGHRFKHPVGVCASRVYEGDWGKPYAARFEVWLTPDSGGPDGRLMGKVFKIEGWQR